MSRVVLAGADEDLALRVKQAADGDVHLLPPGRLPSDPGRLFEQLTDGELPDVLLIGPGAPPDSVLTLAGRLDRSEEQTSELQSRQYLVWRLLLEKNTPMNAGDAS